jgi:hypothetical protein
MSVPTTGRPARRPSVPRALALLAGTIGFTSAILLGMAAGEPPAAIISRAAACGLALSALAFLAGAVGVQVVKESQARESAAPADRAPPPGVGPPPAGAPAPTRPAKAGAVNAPR